MDAATRKQLATLLVASRALRQAMDASVRGDALENQWKYGSYRQFIRKYNQLVGAVATAGFASPILDAYNEEKIPSSMDTLAIQQKAYFDSAYANLSILIAHLENTLEPNESRILSLKDFFQANLRRGVFAVPTAERDVQDIVEQLLIGRGMQRGTDYDRETGRVKVSIKEVVPDFVLLKLDLALEVKLAKTEQRAKDIVDEINADISAYGLRYSGLLFVVYDLGTIRDEQEFRHGLETAGKVDVIVVKH